MNRLCAGVCVIFTFLVLGSLTLLAQAKQVRPFEADFVVYYKLPDGRVLNSPGHYYRNSRGQVREDTGSIGQIIDLNAHTITLLNHQDKTAITYQMPAAEMVPNVRANQPLGPKAETFAHGVVEGHRVTKARLVGPDGSSQEVWMADDLGVAIMKRTQAGNTTTTKTFRNFKTLEPSSSVFEIPHGYSVTKTTIGADSLPSLRVVPGSKPAGRGRGGRR